MNVDYKNECPSPQHSLLPSTGRKSRQTKHAEMLTLGNDETIKTHFLTYLDTTEEMIKMLNKIIHEKLHETMKQNQSSINHNES